MATAPGLDAQRAIKMGAEELQDYMQELFSWSKGMKKKASDQQRAAPAAAPPAAPAAAGPAPPTVNAAPVLTGGREQQAAGGAARHPASHTYEHYRQKWDKFDVDAALAAADEQGIGTGSSSSSSRSGQHPAQQAPDTARGGGTASSRAAASQPVDIPQARVTVPVAPSTRVLPAAAAAGAAPVSAEGWKDAGNDHFRRGQHQRAAECYTCSLELEPSCLAHANRAMARLKLGQVAAAEADCAAALALDPLYTKAYLRRATARRQQGNLLGSVEDCESALRLEPNNKQAAADRAKCVQQLLAREGLQLPVRSEVLPLVVAPANGAQPMDVSGDAATASAVSVPAASLAPAAQAAAAGQERAAASLGADADIGVSSVRRLKPEAAAPAAAAGSAHPAVAPQQGAPPAAVIQVLSPADEDALPDLMQDRGQQPPPQQRQQQEQPNEQPAAGAAQQAGQPSPAASPSSPAVSRTAIAAAAASLTAAASSGGRATVPAASSGATGAFRVPRTGVEFEKGWKALKGDRSQAAYLLALQPAALPKLLKQALTPPLLAAATGALLRPALEQQPAAALALLEALAAVPRFDINLLSVPPRLRAELAADWDAAAAQLAAGGSSGDLLGKLGEVRRRWRL